MTKRGKNEAHDKKKGKDKGQHVTIKEEKWDVMVGE
jgi:hypothetical protein